MTLNSAQPAAGLSIDLDNRWSYLRSRGDDAWQDHAGFLTTALPRVRDVLGTLDLTATAFVVGRDAEMDKEGSAIARLQDSGHELANHSWDHAPGFHAFDETRLEDDIGRTEAALIALGAPPPAGFRAPSFRLSRALLRVLARRGYRYDASSFPNAAGALARAWQRRRFALEGAAARALDGQYGTWRDAWQPLVPHRWHIERGILLEIPVSTLPLLRLPVHFTYLHFLADHAPAIALAYVRTHIALCRARGLAPALLLHATDFLGRDDADAPHFMPGMARKRRAKLAFTARALACYAQHFKLMPLGKWAAQLSAMDTLPSVDITQTRLR